MESCEGNGREESRARKRSCLAGSGERSAHRVGAKRLEARCSHRSGDGAQRFDRFSGVQQLVLKRRGMRQRLGALRGHVDVLEDVGDGRVLGNERDHLHFGATKRAQQRVDLVHPLDERRPAESGAAAEGLVVGNRQGGEDAGGGANAGGLERGNRALRGIAAAFAASDVGVVAPVANQLMSAVGVDDRAPLR